MCCADFGAAFLVTPWDIAEGLAIYFVGGSFALWLIWRGLRRIFKR